jgi:uncharacterized membrane protein YdbT with pleckstrin-like domain
MILRYILAWCILFLGVFLSVVLEVRTKEEGFRFARYLFYALVISSIMLVFRLL